MTHRVPRRKLPDRQHGQPVHGGIPLGAVLCALAHAQLRPEQGHGAGRDPRGDRQGRRPRPTTRVGRPTLHAVHNGCPLGDVPLQTQLYPAAKVRLAYAQSFVTKGAKIISIFRSILR